MIFSFVLITQQYGFLKDLIFWPRTTSLNSSISVSDRYRVPGIGFSRVEFRKKIAKRFFQFSHTLSIPELYLSHGEAMGPKA